MFHSQTSPWPACYNGSGLTSSPAKVQDMIENDRVFGRCKGVDAFIFAMATGKTARAAAEAAGISEPTAYRRLADPDWQNAIDKRRVAIVDMASQAAAGHLEAAVQTLADLLDHESGSVQLGAAKAILDFGLRSGPNEVSLKMPTALIINRNYIGAGEGEQ